MADDGHSSVIRRPSLLVSPHVRTTQSYRQSPVTLTSVLAQAITNPAKYSTRGDTWPPQSLLATLCALEILERIAAWMGDGGWRVQHFGLQAALALVSLTREPPVKQRMQMASTIEEILEAVIREPTATVGDADVDDLREWVTQLSEAAVERRVLEGPQEHA